MYVDSDSEEEGFEPDERENYRVTRPDLVGVLPANFRSLGQNPTRL